MSSVNSIASCLLKSPQGFTLRRLWRKVLSWKVVVFFLISFVIISGIEERLYAGDSTLQFKESSFSPIRGPNDAAVTIVEFSDFQCPFCRKVTKTLQEVLRYYPTQVKWVFKHFPLSFHPDAPLAHQATFAAAEQGQFWKMHDLLFSKQQVLKRENLLGYAQVLGLDVPSFRDALDSGQYLSMLQKDIAKGNQLGVNATPTFFINGTKLVGIQSFATFKAVIDKALQQEPERLDLHPNKNFNPITAMGPVDAPVVVEVFGDFQSSMSAHVATILRSFPEYYPKQVQLVFRHFPLRFHRQAKLAHEASLAAGAQGQFWPMHDLLFQHPQNLGEKQLVEDAAQLGLDLELFQKDLTTHRYLEAVRQDLLEGMNRDVRGVPTLFINGKRIDGTLSFASLRAMIDHVLKPPTLIQAAIKK